MGPSLLVQVQQWWLGDSTEPVFSPLPSSSSLASSPLVVMLHAPTTLAGTEGFVQVSRESSSSLVIENVALMKEFRYLTARVLTSMAKGLLAECAGLKTVSIRCVHTADLRHNLINMRWAQQTGRRECVMYYCG